MGSEKEDSPKKEKEEKGTVQNDTKPKSPPKKKSNVFLFVSVLIVLISLGVGFYQIVLPTIQQNNREYIPNQPRKEFSQRTSLQGLLESRNPTYDMKALEQLHNNPPPTKNVWISPVVHKHTTPPKTGTIHRVFEESASRRWFVELGRARFTFLTAHLVRLEWSDSGNFENSPTIVFSERERYLKEELDQQPLVQVRESLEHPFQVEILTSALRVLYGSEESPYWNSPEFTPTTLKITVLEMNSSWHPGLTERRNLGGTLRTLDRVDGSTTIEPGLFSLAGWAIVVDTHSPLAIPDPEGILPFWAKNRTIPLGSSKSTDQETRNDEELQNALGESYLDWYLFGYGTEFRKGLKDFTRVAGKIPLPPKYSFGLWWSRWWIYSDEDLKGLVQDFSLYRVPLDNLVVDMDWHWTAYHEMNSGAVDLSGQSLGWTGYSWNYTLFPNPPQFTDWCHQRGLRVTLNLHPASGIQPHEHFYEAMCQGMGQNPDDRVHVPFDISDRKFTKEYFLNVIHPLEEEDGIDFWWLDYQYLQITNMTNLNPTFWLNHVFFHDMERPRGNSLQYSQQQGFSSSGSNSNSNSLSQLRGLIFHRWGGLGSHRYQIGFSGDTWSTWKSLDFQVFFTSTSANVGFGYWSHDIGGFMSRSRTNPELYLRWVQWGALSTIFRTHAWRQEYLERRIWKYPDYYFLTMREAIYLRYSLLPHLYTRARESFDDGVSMLYPLYYDFPQEESSYRTPTEAMLGPDLLIAPVTQPAAETNILSIQRVFLPGQPKPADSNDEIPPSHQDEVEWIEWHSLTAFLPGGYVRAIALDEIPIYVRAGTILPMYPFTERFENLHHLESDGSVPLVLSVFPGTKARSGKYRLYEDDGLSTEYKSESQRNIAWTLIESVFSGGKEHSSPHVEWNGIVHPIEGRFDGMRESRSYLVRLVGVTIPKEVQVNGKLLPRVERPISNHPLGFQHWAIHRDPALGWADENSSLEEFGWFYDYQRLTLVIRTDSQRKDQETRVTVRWAEHSRKEFEDHLELLHQGWVGELNTVARVGFYWSGSSFSKYSEDCLKLPHRLKDDWNSWKSILEQFTVDYHTLLGHIQNAQGSNDRGNYNPLFISHLRDRARKA